MRFGLFGSAQARRPVSGAELTDSSQGFREWIANNVEAEALGFHSTFVVEHHFTGFGQVSASLNLLTWLGARTSTLRLGTAVLVLPWHNPVLLAEQAATLDLLSGGRLDFGVGKGYRYNEFAGFCVDMEEADARFDESLAVITKAFTNNAPFSHKGRYWRFDNIIVEPPPAQRPHPPFWMGAGSQRSVAEVSRRGYNLLLGQYDLAETSSAMSRSSRRMSKRRAASSTRCRLGSRAPCTSRKTRTISARHWSGASRGICGSIGCRSGRATPASVSRRMTRQKYASCATTPRCSAPRTTSRRNWRRCAPAASNTS